VQNTGVSPSRLDPYTQQPPLPSRYASISSSDPPPPITQRSATMPMPLPNTVTPTPYDMSNHHTPHTEMPRGPQPSSQGWSYPGTNEREYGSDYPMDEYSEQNPQGMSDLQKRSLRSFPFAFGTKSHGKRPGKGSPSSSPTPDQLPCRLCQKLTPSHIIEHWGGFCCERHRTQWMCSPTPDQLPCRLCHKLTPRHIIEHWGGFCCERHKTQWNAVYG